jgi:hypothetical protein
MSEYCQIRVKTHLDLDWSAWFDQLAITNDADGCTTIAGVLADQAALYGLIGKVRNLGLTLVAVQRIIAEHFGPTE